jgi:hypothetical protein
MNKVMIRDTNLPLSIDEFLEYFTSCIIISLVDYFSSYN